MSLVCNYGLKWRAFWVTFIHKFSFSQMERTGRERERARERASGKMGSVTNGCSSPVFPSPLNFLENKAFFHKRSFGNLIISNKSSRRNGIFCKISGTGIGEDPGKTSKSRMEDYNTAMKNMMRNPYEYHHDLGMNYTRIKDKLIVGSQPQKPEDIDHLKQGENVAYILNLQQDKDIEYWGIDFQSILKRCKELGIRHMRRPARDFDPNSLRNGLPKAVSSLEWAISEGKGRIYVHCTAGLGRAPAVAIAYLFWFFNMDLNTAYNKLTKKRPCGPNKRAIRGATYDLAKNDPWKEPFESLPEYAFENVAGWERKLIRDRVRALRGT